MSTQAPTRPETQARPGHEHDGERPHLFRIVAGLLDAHFNRVDFFDTIGGAEVMRVYRLRHARHQQRRHAA